MSLTRTSTLILYVEDDVLIQEYLQTALEDAGYEVLIVSSGADAIDQVERRLADLGGMITDVNLGRGMKGWEVGRHARTLLPELPIVYVSGGSEHEWGREGVSRSMMIAKPFACEQVVMAITALIGSADAIPMDQGPQSLTTKYDRGSPLL